MDILCVSGLDSTLKEIVVRRSDSKPPAVVKAASSSSSGDPSHFDFLADLEGDNKRRRVEAAAVCSDLDEDAAVPDAPEVGQFEKDLEAILDEEEDPSQRQDLLDIVADGQEYVEAMHAEAECHGEWGEDDGYQVPDGGEENVDIDIVLEELELQVDDRMEVSDLRSDSRAPIGRVHSIASRSLKATCRKHCKCILWVNVPPGKYIEILADTYKWLAKSREQGPAAHQESARAIKRSWGMHVK